VEGHRLGRGLIVLGTHRSGTSAVTGVIDSLGLPACHSGDRMPVRRWNAKGNYESKSLSNFDNRLLNTLGGEWFAPPDLSPGWADDPSLDPWRSEAAELFAKAHRSPQWVWKDPRVCVLMPFWDTVLGAGMPRVIVVRNPMESAMSLQARNRMPADIALALAERSLRSALRDSAGAPVLIFRYADLFDDLQASCIRLAEFLEDCDLAINHPLSVNRAEAFVSPGLRHHTNQEADATMQMTSNQERLWCWAHDRVGSHKALNVDGLPDETPSAARIFELALESHRVASSD
jgi:hypothetical protein